MIIERVITIEYLHESMSQQLLCKFPDQSAFDFDYTQSGIWSPLLPRVGKCDFSLSDVSSLDLKRKLLGDDDKIEEFPPQKKLKDFDYTQSGIWSPLLPRVGKCNFTLSDVSSLDLKRKLLGDDDKIEEFPPQEKLKDFDYTQSGIWSPLLPRVGRCNFTSSDVSSLDLKRKRLGDDDKIEEFPPQEKLKKVGSKIKKKMIKALTQKKNKNNGLDFSPVITRESTPNKVWRKALKAASKPFKKHKVAPSLRLQNFQNLGDII